MDHIDIYSSKMYQMHYVCPDGTQDWVVKQTQVDRNLLQANQREVHLPALWPQESRHLSLAVSHPPVADLAHVLEHSNKLTFEQIFQIWHCAGQQPWAFSSDTARNCKKWLLFNHPGSKASLATRTAARRPHCTRPNSNIFKFYWPILTASRASAFASARFFLFSLCLWAEHALQICPEPSERQATWDFGLEQIRHMVSPVWFFKPEGFLLWSTGRTISGSQVRGDSRPARTAPENVLCTGTPTSLQWHRKAFRIEFQRSEAAFKVSLREPMAMRSTRRQRKQLYTPWSEGIRKTQRSQRIHMENWFEINTSLKPALCFYLRLAVLILQRIPFALCASDLPPNNHS